MTDHLRIARQVRGIPLTTKMAERLELFPRVGVYRIPKRLARVDHFCTLFLEVAEERSEWATRFVSTDGR